MHGPYERRHMTPPPCSRTVKQLEVPGGVGCDTRTQPPQPWQLTVGPEGGGGGEWLTMIALLNVTLLAADETGKTNLHCEF